MTMYCIRYKLALLCLFACFSTGLAQTLEVTVSNIRTNNGQLCVALFDSEEGFKKEQPCWEKSYPKSQIEQGEVVLTICVPPGIYGLSVLDDENMDGKMNYNRIGIPQEGFGFSDYQHKGLRRPALKNFTFSIEKNQVLKIDVVLKYF
jgi:uncharacterized protein (DUF2141 family)